MSCLSSFSIQFAVIESRRGAHNEKIFDNNGNGCGSVGKTTDGGDW